MVKPSVFECITNRRTIRKYLPKPVPKEVLTKESTPLEILKKRYARGEIKKEEYDKIKKDLQD